MAGSQATAAETSRERFSLFARERRFRVHPHIDGQHHFTFADDFREIVDLLLPAIPLADVQCFAAFEDVVCHERADEISSESNERSGSILSGVALLSMHSRHRT